MFVGARLFSIMPAVAVSPEAAKAAKAKLPVFSFFAAITGAPGTGSVLTGARGGTDPGY